jgi:hypothetical protein
MYIAVSETFFANGALSDPTVEVPLNARSAEDVETLGYHRVLLEVVANRTCDLFLVVKKNVMRG